MIIVTITLLSARTGKSTKLAEMNICNDGTSAGRHRNYDGRALRKGSNTPFRTGRVENHDAPGTHVWNLVAKMLKDMGFG